VGGRNDCKREMPTDSIKKDVWFRFEFEEGPNVHRNHGKESLIRRKREELGGEKDHPQHQEKEMYNKSLI